MNLRTPNNTKCFSLTFSSTAYTVQDNVDLTVIQNGPLVTYSFCNSLAAVRNFLIKCKMAKFQ